MNEEWLVDGRKIPDEVRGYIRKIAVQAVRENGQSPEVVAKVLNFNRSCLYEWLKQYDEAGQTHDHKSRRIVVKVSHHVYLVSDLYY